MNGRNVIGITGRFGSGKSTLAELLAELIPGARVTALADELKEDVHAMLGRQLGTAFEDVADDRAALEALKGESLGPIYQGYGELCRCLYGEIYWIERLCRRLDRLDIERPIVADVRYPNEARWVRSTGGIVIAVTGPCRREGDRRSTDHPSERYVEEIAASAVVVVENYGDLAALRDDARRLAMVI
jgi:energy-coupling factor transporter ATP-binding protein EcfA2